MVISSVVVDMSIGNIGFVMRYTGVPFLNGPAEFGSSFPSPVHSRLIQRKLLDPWIFYFYNEKFPVGK
jgi:hypothetical protein